MLAAKLLSIRESALSDNADTLRERVREFLYPHNVWPTGYAKHMTQKVEALTEWLAAALVEARLEEARWWIKNPKLCPEDIDCPECRVKRERLSDLERQAASVKGEGK